MGGQLATNTWQRYEPPLSSWYTSVCVSLDNQEEDLMLEKRRFGQPRWPEHELEAEKHISMLLPVATLTILSCCRSTHLLYCGAKTRPPLSREPVLTWQNLSIAAALFSISVSGCTFPQSHSFFLKYLFCNSHFLRARQCSLKHKIISWDYHIMWWD